MADLTNGSDRLGDILVRLKAISRPQLKEAIEKQGEKGTRLGVLLQEMGFCTSQQVTQALSEQSGLELVDLSNMKVPSTVLEFVPREVAEEHLVFPIERVDNTLKLAVADPYDLATIEDLRFRLNTEIASVLADPGDIQGAIERNYGVSTEEEAL
ncbi:MAG: hypothetical protein HY608_06830, partial [Planctomycetes bacterium]|nr:hypothetical protein [Planctomycetota bacterium]